MRVRGSLLLSCLIASGCQSTSGPENDSGHVVIRTDRTEYVASDVIIVTTTNRSGNTLFDDHCAGEVQGYDYLDRWNASYGMGRACVWSAAETEQSYGIAIAPGSVHVDTLHVNDRAYTGTWRVELLIRDESGTPLPPDQRVSNTFKVRGTWAP